MKYAVASEPETPPMKIGSGSLSIRHDSMISSRNNMTPITGVKFLISGALVVPISAGVLSFGAYPASLESNTLTIRKPFPSARFASTHYDFKWEEPLKESSAVVEIIVDPIFEVLGAHGVGRLSEFRSYRQGWDGGKG